MTDLTDTPTDVLKADEIRTKPTDFLIRARARLEDLTSLVSVEMARKLLDWIAAINAELARRQSQGDDNAK